jgi:hypothetical protein
VKTTALRSYAKNSRRRNLSFALQAKNSFDRSDAFGQAQQLLNIGAIKQQCAFSFHSALRPSG